MFDHGEIVEFGNHDELMGKADGVYKQLIRAQEIEKATQLEDAVLSGNLFASIPFKKLCVLDAEDISCHKSMASISRSKKIRRTLELDSMHSARSSLGPVQFEMLVFFTLPIMRIKILKEKG